MEHIDLRKYYAEKESVMGRPRYDSEKLIFDSFNSIAQSKPKVNGNFNFLKERRCGSVENP